MWVQIIQNVFILVFHIIPIYIFENDHVVFKHNLWGLRDFWHVKQQGNNDWKSKKVMFQIKLG